METSTFVRGFSNTYVPDKKIEVKDFQFIEGGELERTWKQARRQRLKQQEDKIWSNFLERDDLLETVIREDRYQFIEDVPEECLKQLIDTEIKRVKNSAEVQGQGGAGDSPRRDEVPCVTFDEISNDEVFQIFDDKEDDLSNDDANNDSLDSPCTVRERDDAFDAFTMRCPQTETRACGVYLPPTSDGSNVHSANTAENKTSDTNMANMIESSIYCAKLKDLRSKLQNELNDIISSLEMRNVSLLEPTELRSMCNRATEYANRFNRVHLYHLQRQVHDIKRHSSQEMPFAKHTQFQSQMTRIISLHHATLQALQAFHKSFASTGCLRECADQLLATCAAMREADAVCSAVAVPTNFTAAKEMYNDNLLSVVGAVETSVNDYVARVTDFILAAENTRLAYMKDGREKNKKKKKTIGSWSRNATRNSSNTEANARLSMYSMETISLKDKKKKKSYKIVKDATKIKALKEENSKRDSPHLKKKGEGTPHSHRKTPRMRTGRPLMRDSRQGKTPRARIADTDIQTMVENVDPPSSRNLNFSSDVSFNSPRDQRSNRALPALTPALSPAPAPALPMLKIKGVGVNNTPRNATKRSSPYIGKAGARAAPCASAADASMDAACLSPVFKIQCAKKEHAAALDAGTNSAINGKMKSARSGPDSAHVQSQDKGKAGEADGPNSEVTRLLRQLCGGDVPGSGRNERFSGAKNAALLCMSASSPRGPTTPELLRILEETIQKKVPKYPYLQQSKQKDKLHLAFNIPQTIADNLFQYRTKFVQHMLASSMYANSAVGKPWEMISSLSDRILDEIITACAKEMELHKVINEIFKSETQ